ncbi:DUF3349 domain-containing protein [Rhodococcus sp. NPDC003318]|uniref:DUF3349 domain-containing protein n=1 Tax=Rhodococcus sp. NPDC003318 TaxID=3364503 RepID=UPI0036B7D81D
MPEQDYIPLIALLRSRLTDDEARTVTDTLVDQLPSPIDKCRRRAENDPVTTGTDPSPMPGG